jgi:hypothetical protein
MKKETFFDRDNSHYFMDDPGAIAAYCKKNFPEEVSHILRVADEVCNHYFLFDLKWDMERTYEPVVFADKIDWNINPAGDPEFIWQFNRHRFFICLGQAYQLTGDEKYAKAFTELLAGWVQEVPLNETYAGGPWRSLETGLRGEYWNKALRYFMDSPYLTDDFLQLFYDSMIRHANHLVESHSPYRYMSNWGVIENHGLLELSLMLPQSPKMEEYRAFALKNLEIEARMEIMRDGMQWEQSLMYHNEVFHCYLDVILLCRRNGITVPASILERVHQMALANVKLLRPNRHQLLMGDSDDTDVTDLISVGAYVFRDPVLRYFGADEMDFESVWDIGMAAVEEYRRIPKQEPEFTSCLLEDSGNAVLRSDWSREANMLHLVSGTLGAGHGHGDKLHIDFMANGEEVLVDAGRYTYVPGDDRFTFKDPSYHNTITVDGKPFYVCKDSWECTKLAQAVKPHIYLGKACEYIEAGHLGYMDQPEGVMVNRKVIHIRPEIYIVADELYTGGTHTYQQYFHFNEQGKVEKTGENCYTYVGKEARTAFHFVSENLTITAEKSRISRNYNHCEPNDALRIETKGNGFTSLLTVILADAKRQVTVETLPVKSALKGIFYPKEMAEAIKITTPETEYVVIICHQEVNSPTDLVEADGCMGYGNVIVFDKKEDCLVGEVLNY